MAEASAALADLSESVHAVGNTELEVFFGEVDDLSRQLEAARVAVLGQALSRGVVAQSDRANPTSWVIGCAPSYRAGGAAQLVRVTRATQAVRNTGLGAAVLGARVGLRNAAVALTEMDKLRPRLRDEAVATVWAGFLQIATDHGPAQIRELRDKLIATYGHDGQFQRRQDQLKHQVSLSQPLDDDGMAEYRLRLDPEGKEVLEAILGPLSAPRPTPSCPDLRPGDQRRGQALVEICRRAAAAGGAAPATTKAAVFITVSLQDLQARCAAGSTLTSSTGSTAEPPACSTAPCSAGDTTPSPTKRAGPQQPPPAKSPGTFDHPTPPSAATGGHCGTPATPVMRLVRANAKTCPLVEHAVDLVLGRLRAGAHDHPVDVDVMRPGRDPRHTVSNVL